MNAMFNISLIGRRSFTFSQVPRYFNGQIPRPLSIATITFDILLSTPVEIVFLLKNFLESSFAMFISPLVWIFTARRKM